MHPDTDTGPDTTRDTGTSPDTVTITVRYFAGAAAAAGRDEEPLRATVPLTLNAALTALVEARPAVSDVLERCSFLWDGAAVLDAAAALPTGGAGDNDGHTLDVLPPFAGG